MAAKKPSVKKKTKTQKSKSSNLPATRGMLQAVRKELKHEMREGFRAIDAKFHSVDARFNTIESKFKTIDARFNTIESKFKTIDARFNTIESKFKAIDARFDTIESKISALDSKVENVLALVAKMQLSNEQQLADNRIVLEALQAMTRRQNDLESRMDGIEETVKSISRIHSDRPRN